MSNTKSSLHRRMPCLVYTSHSPCDPPDLGGDDTRRRYVAAHKEKKSRERRGLARRGECGSANVIADPALAAYAPFLFPRDSHSQTKQGQDKECRRTPPACLPEDIICSELPRLGRSCNPHAMQCNAMRRPDSSALRAAKMPLRPLTPMRVPD